MSKPSYHLVPWTVAGKTSGPMELNGNQIVGFILPSTIASTAITFNTSTSVGSYSGTGITWFPVCDSSGAAVSFTVNASTADYYGFSQDQIAKFTGVENIQMAAGSSEAANQKIYIVMIPRPSI